MNCALRSSTDLFSVCSVFSVVALLVLFASSVHAADRYAVVVTGASGGQVYAEKYEKWRVSFLATLKQTFNYPDDHIFALAETESRNVAQSTRDNVRRVFAGLRGRLASDDLLLVMLIGHGTTGEDDEAKFNLVGPDLKSAEWAELLKPIQARIVFVNTTGGSFPFLRRLSGPGRIVITATDSAAQQFETVFPEFFLKAFERPGSRRGQERARVDLGSVRLRQWRGSPVVRAAWPVVDRTSAARRQRGRRGAGSAESRAGWHAGANGLSCAGAARRRRSRTGDAARGARAAARRSESAKSIVFQYRSARCGNRKTADRNRPAVATAAR